jgi:hypothetical protein
MEWLSRVLRRRDGHLNTRLTLAELSRVTGIKRITLYMAVRDGRLWATQSGHIWLSTLRAVKEAQDAGRLKVPEGEGE